MKQKMMAISQGVVQKESNYVYYWLFALWGLNYGLVSPVYVVFLFSTGLDAFQVSLVNIVFILGCLLLQLPAGAIADSWGRRKTYLASTIFNSICFLIYAFASHWPAFVLAEFFLLWAL